MEEPRLEDGAVPHLEIVQKDERLHIAVPVLPKGMGESDINVHLKSFASDLVQKHIRGEYIAWYYTPMALKFTRHLKPLATVYDCMDELSQFKLAPPELTQLEDELLRQADVVFTGGMSLYEYKRHRHPNIHPFPSSVDVAHFRQAREPQIDPADQAAIPKPRIGYTGVIDERFDIDLIKGIAELRPDWQLVMIGPVVKIDPLSLPRAPNIHYLGGKSYDELPRYLAGWNAAILPFARNEATRFISPTKTPEYLAAGRHVVSTSIRDVVRVYGEAGFVKIADEPHACVAAIESMMADESKRAAWLARVDDFLSRNSWDETFNAMWQLVEAAVEYPLAKRKIPARTWLVPVTPPMRNLSGVPASPPG